MALSNVALFGAAFLTPVVAGKITHTLGWEWTFYLVAILAAGAFPLTFFLVPETAFRRPDTLRADFEYADGQASMTGRSGRLQRKDDAASEASHNVEEKEPSSPTNGEPQTHSSTEEGCRERAHVPEKASFTQTLKPFNGRKTDERFFKLLLRPFPLFFQPAILWVSASRG